MCTRLGDSNQMLKLEVSIQFGLLLRRQRSSLFPSQQICDITLILLRSTELDYPLGGRSSCDHINQFIKGVHLMTFY